MSERTPQRGPVWQARLRRAPRYEAFLGVGALLGFVVGIVSGLTGDADPNTGRVRLVAYLAVGFAMVGAMLGGLVAVALERVGRRRG